MARKAGRPKFEPSEKIRADVYSYAQVGITQEDICKILEIDLKTLRKHFRRELDTAAIQANAVVGGVLYRMAASGENPAATFFWGKTKMGLREKDPPLPEQKPIKRVWVRGETRSSKLPKADDDEKNGTE